MSPFNNVKGGPHRESLETRGIMETVSRRCFIYSSVSSLKFEIQKNLFVSFLPFLSPHRVKLEEDALSFILLSQQIICYPCGIFLICVPIIHCSWPASSITLTNISLHHFKRLPQSLPLSYPVTQRGKREIRYVCFLLITILGSLPWTHSSHSITERGGRSLIN